MLKQLMKEKILVFPSFSLEVVTSLNLNLNEFLLLLYFWNYDNVSFDVVQISKIIKIGENEILKAFNALLGKKLITLDSFKDKNGKMMEVINLDNFYTLIDESLKKQEKEQEKVDIYTIFQTEFGRPISMEYEIIRAWLEKGFSEELILGALKEAVYNGVSNLRYIDKILYEWQRKGYKNMNEVSNRNKQTKEEVKELFDYNWLDDNE